MAFTNEQIIGKIIRLVNRKMAEFKQPREVETEVGGEVKIELVERTPKEVIDFLTGLNKTKIVKAVKAEIAAEQADDRAKFEQKDSNHSEAITGIDSL